MPAGASLPPVAMQDFVAQWADVRAEVLAAVERVGASGWLVLGAEVEAFERALAGRWGLRHAVGMGNCLDATELALRALGIRAGDRVLTTPLSAFATTLAVVRAGGHPVFVDTDLSGQIDLGACAEVVGRAGARERPRFVLPVHLFGHAVPLGPLGELCAETGLVAVEDAAQAVGAASGGRPVGSVGAVTVTSFYPTKNLGGYGDGGAALTGDEALAGRLRALRDYGQSAKYRHTMVGANSRLDELQAAILRDGLLPRLEAATARRREIAARYRAEVVTRPGVLDFVPEPAGSTGVYHIFPVRVDRARRDAFMAHLAEAGIGSAVHYPVAIPEQEAMAEVPHTVVGNLACARALVASEVSLPIHPYVDDAGVARVVAACNGWRG